MVSVDHKLTQNIATFAPEKPTKNVTIYYPTKLKFMGTFVNDAHKDAHMKMHRAQLPFSSCKSKLPFFSTLFAVYFNVDVWLRRI